MYNEREHDLEERLAEWEVTYDPRFTNPGDLPEDMRPQWYGDLEPGEKYTINNYRHDSLSNYALDELLPDVKYAVANFEDMISPKGLELGKQLITDIEDYINGDYSLDESLFSKEDAERLGKEALVKAQIGLEDIDLSKVDDQDLDKATADVEKDRAVAEQALDVEKGSLDQAEPEDIYKIMGNTMNEKIEKIIECLETVEGSAQDIAEAIHVHTGMKLSEAAEVYQDILEERQHQTSKIDRIYEALNGETIHDAFDCCEPEATHIADGDGEFTTEDVEHPCKSLEDQVGEKI